MGEKARHLARRIMGSATGNVPFHMRGQAIIDLMSDWARKTSNMISRSGRRVKHYRKIGIRRHKLWKDYRERRRCQATACWISAVLWLRLEFFYASAVIDRVVNARSASESTGAPLSTST
jgi:hypothetical protein